MTEFMLVSFIKTFLLINKIMFAVEKGIKNRFGQRCGRQTGEQREVAHNVLVVKTHDLVHQHVAVLVCQRHLSGNTVALGRGVTKTQRHALHVHSDKGTDKQRQQQR